MRKPNLPEITTTTTVFSLQKSEGVRAEVRKSGSFCKVGRQYLGTGNLHPHLALMRMLGADVIEFYGEAKV